MDDAGFLESFCLIGCAAPDFLFLPELYGEADRHVRSSGIPAMMGA